MIAQGAILILSAAGIWILSWRGTSRWGWIVGLAAQPFWLWVTWSAGQWLLFVNAVVWTGAFAHGLVKHWNAPAAPSAERLAELEARLAEYQHELLDTTWQDNADHFQKKLVKTEAEHFALSTTIIELLEILQKWEPDHATGEERHTILRAMYQVGLLVDPTKIAGSKEGSP